MGYSHYFPQTRSFTDTEWSTIQQSAKKLFTECSDFLANGMGDVDTEPEANDAEILFNGIEDMSYEPFSVSKEHDDSYNFCKTAERPYDIAVVAMLVLINTYAPGVLKIESDGNGGDWKEGLSLAKKIDNKCVLPVGIKQ